MAHAISFEILNAAAASSTPILRFAGTTSRFGAQNDTASLFSTSVTPGALHAAAPASFRSFQELAVPVSATFPLQFFHHVFPHLCIRLHFKTCLPLK